MMVNTLPVREALLDRRQKIDAAIVAGGTDATFNRLIAEVDAALARLENGSYGLCETCHDAIEPDRLLADPLARFCLDHLTPEEQSALQRDLDLAARIQHELLPPSPFRAGCWEAAYAYKAVGPVSGDYCDLISAANGDLHFIVGDVSGKGIAAAMLMTHLHAMFRTLISLELPLPDMMERASRLFCESTLPTHYATLVCGRARASGEVEVCNAGHVPPLVVSGGDVQIIASGGLPLGMFCEERFSTTRLRLSSDDVIVLYTDGVTDAENPAGADYGHSRMVEQMRAAGDRRRDADAQLAGCVADLLGFRAGASQLDDVTLMLLRRSV
jgi:sigma-B regulation protein RsbU (phosphoserine phosphatase)